MSRFLKPLATTVVILLLVGAAGAYYVTHKNNNTYRVTAYFVKAIGLYPHSDVDVLGVPIGKVTSVIPAGSRVKVIMDIDKKYKVPSDAFASIVPPSLISDRYVQFTPVYRGGAALQDGSVLNTDRTQVPAELDDVYKQLKKLLDAIKPGKLGQPGPLGTLVVQLNKALHGREDQLHSTLVSASNLTQTLADARGSLGGLLTNLNGLFTQLATRAGTLGTLNRNFAEVLTALSLSRGDLKGTLQNVAGLTQHLGELIRNHRNQLGRDLGIAARVLKQVIVHRASVGESLSWLPVVAIGASNAFHGGPNKDVDVRDANNERLECSLLNALPDGPVKDQLKALCKSQTGQPRQAGTSTTSPAPSIPTLPFNCKRAVKKVKQQLKRLDSVNVPPQLKSQIVTPLQKNVKKLARKCKQIGDAIKHPRSLLKKLEKQIPNLPKVFDSPFPNLGGVSGNAAGVGGGAVPPAGGPGFLHGVGSFFGHVLSFMGFSS